MHALAQSWLSLQCKMISDVSQGIVILGNRLSVPLAPTASWPIGSKQHAGLSTAAKNATEKGKAVVENYDSENDIIACPIVINNQVLGVVALETRSRNKSGQQALLQMLHWGASWLTFLLDEEKSSQKDRLISVVELIATTLEKNTLTETSLAITSELATKLACDRVSIGFKDKKNIQVSAISKTAVFDQKSQLVRDIGSLMDEACDQDQLITLPINDSSSFQVTISHDKFIKQHGQISVCTLPLIDNGNHIGAIAFERSSEHAFDLETQELIKHFGQFVGPILELKRKKEVGFINRSVRLVTQFTDGIIGSDHPKTKAFVFLIALIGILFSFTRIEYRVAADAYLEGSSTRSIVAPIEGFIDIATFSAGDLIKKDQLLVKLADKDLKLEKLKLISKKNQLHKEYRSELAGHDRTKIGILNYQILQIDTQINLVDQKLKNTEILSPFDGIILSGDLKHNLGSPIEKGQVLFEITPENNYKIILKVDETDITEIAKEQTGHILLSALPGKALPFTVDKITPVSESKDGSNYFQVEASLDTNNEILTKQITEQLRPGMEGVGKVNIEERKLFWIWTHKLNDWLKLWWWSWQS